MRQAEQGVTAPQEFAQGKTFPGKVKDSVINTGLRGGRWLNNKLIVAEVLIAGGALGFAGGAAVAGAEAAAATGVGVAKAAGIAAGVDKGTDIVVFEPIARKRGLIDNKTHSLNKDGGVVYQLKQTVKSVWNQVAPQRMQAATV